MEQLLFSHQSLSGHSSELQPAHLSFSEHRQQANPQRAIPNSRFIVCQLSFCGNLYAFIIAQRQTNAVRKYVLFLSNRYKAERNQYGRLLGCGIIRHNQMRVRVNGIVCQAVDLHNLADIFINGPIMRLVHIVFGDRPERVAV